ncbi:MAG: tetraacyldisaccharide 4'-kinase [Bacteroidota bacterium]
MIVRVILLFPFTFFYWLATSARNKFFYWGWRTSRSFPIRIIGIGNLSMGGAGKSPMVEYIVRLLSSKNNMTILSRGYKRKTKGFAEASVTSLSDEVGDEPKQFKKKFPEITVAVCEDRCTGIEEITGRHKETEVIILDDAYQHRKVKAGLNILLTDYHKLFTRDYIFPSGTLRESREGAKRADVIVVTKCPLNLCEEEKNAINNEITLYIKHNTVFFSFLKYTGIKSLHDGRLLADFKKHNKALLFTGIADPSPLKKHLEEIFKEIYFIRFSDHHEYSSGDLVRIQETFNNIAEENKIIITTEKDAMRLEKPEPAEIIKHLPVFIAHIEIDFFPADKITFNQILMEYAEHDRKNS